MQSLTYKLALDISNKRIATYIDKIKKEDIIVDKNDHNTLALRTIKYLTLVRETIISLYKKIID